MNEAFSRLREYDTIFVWVLEKNERAIRFITNMVLNGKQ